MKRTILLADNDPNVREKWGKLLKNAGFRVRLAASPSEARAKLEGNQIDLAILDMRLIDDDEESDITGLTLAAERAFRHVPKIIFTAFPVSFEQQRHLWEPIGGKPPAVMGFVKKDEKPHVLQEEIHHAFAVWPRLSMLSSLVTDQIKADHRAIRSQARWSNSLSLLMSVLGFFVILTGIVAAIWQDTLGVAILSSLTGLVLEAVGYLFFLRSDRANDRMDLYHQELLQTYGLEFLLSVAERLPAPQENECIQRAIQAIMDSWYPAARGNNGDKPHRSPESTALASGSGEAVPASGDGKEQVDA